MSGPDARSVVRNLYALSDELQIAMDLELAGEAYRLSPLTDAMRYSIGQIDRYFSSFGDANLSDELEKYEVREVDRALKALKCRPRVKASGERLNAVWPIEHHRVLIAALARVAAVVEAMLKLCRRRLAVPARTPVQFRSDVAYISKLVEFDAGSENREREISQAASELGRSSALREGSGRSAGSWLEAVVDNLIEEFGCHVSPTVAWARLSTPIRVWYEDLYLEVVHNSGGHNLEARDINTMEPMLTRSRKTFNDHLRKAKRQKLAKKSS